MVASRKILERRRMAISAVCMAVITYPNMMWMPWNVAALDRGEMTAFWVSTVFRCAFFFLLFYLQLGFNLRRVGEERAIVRFGKNLLFSAAAGVVFMALSYGMPLLAIQSGTVGKYLLFQFIVVALICSFIGHIGQLYDVQSKKESEIERLKLEYLQSRYDALANQMNPHFFFNSLGGISSLVIRGDEEQTLEYIDRLSDIFRYTLRDDANRLVTLEEEIRFVRAFSYVMEVRFGANLTFDIEIEPAAARSMIPVLSLLPLLENVSTHNRIDSEHRMRVRIYTADNRVIVSNLVSPKLTKLDTNGSGLINLDKRFELLTGKRIEIEESDDMFTVKLPL